MVSRLGLVVDREVQNASAFGIWHSLYTGQKKVALLDVETHDNPIPLESYTMRQGKVWAVICHPGKPFIIINLKRCDN